MVPYIKIHQYDTVYVTQYILCNSWVILPSPLEIIGWTLTLMQGSKLRKNFACQGVKWHRRSTPPVPQQLPTKTVCQYSLSDRRVSVECGHSADTWQTLGRHSAGTWRALGRQTQWTTLDEHSQSTRWDLWCTYVNNFIHIHNFCQYKAWLWKDIESFQVTFSPVAGGSKLEVEYIRSFFAYSC